eukprot:366260-Chlamydomonas_euryale.AAC.9
MCLRAHRCPSDQSTGGEATAQIDAQRLGCNTTTAASCLHQPHSSQQPSGSIPSLVPAAIRLHLRGVEDGPPPGCTLTYTACALLSLALLGRSCVDKT